MRTKSALAAVVAVLLLSLVGCSKDSESAKCPTQAEVDDVNSSLDGADFATMSGEELSNAMNDALDTMDKYLPSDYDGDLDTLRTAFGQFTDALAGVDLSDPSSMTPEQTAAMQTASEAMDSEETNAANDRIEKYFEDNCPDVNFGSSDTSS